ncbi:MULTISPECIES: biotin transporter BioY [Caloramator]|uniref:Biotin transporter n=1 Tax=Caloramator proteoclasticus DSM 10124 TaxID=1121262 RepID=A0A1M4TKG0_9CLOT|nr:MULTISPECIES: biotin transporter BioY [Caloramator]SHE44886.1 biotin transport system substrate-specific component [Caloramator proteoclasticus DSM 10124]
MKTRDLVIISLFSILTAIGAYINIPIFYVPFTLQIIFVIMSGIVLGAKRAALSQILYLLMGLIGIPVFAGGTAGIQVILKPSFGYIVGFILGAYTTGRIIEKVKRQNIVAYIIAGLLGLAVVYLLGVTYLYLILNIYFKKGVTMFWAIKNGILIFLPFDVIKCFIAAFVGLKINKIRN